jgi:mannosyl-oligosaccharide alpha-1,2-mannosidase
MYKKFAWNIWKSIKKHCKTESGFSNIQGVDSVNPKKTDGMQSFFLAETMVFSFLIFRNICF